VQVGVEAFLRAEEEREDIGLAVLLEPVLEGLEMA